MQQSQPNRLGFGNSSLNDAWSLAVVEHKKVFFREAGARYDLARPGSLSNWDEQQIEQALFPQRPALSVWRKHPEPDWAKIHEDLQTHKDG